LKDYVRQIGSSLASCCRAARRLSVTVAPKRSANREPDLVQKGSDFFVGRWMTHHPPANAACLSRSRMGAALGGGATAARVAIGPRPYFPPKLASTWIPPLPPILEWVLMGTKGYLRDNMDQFYGSKVKFANWKSLLVMAILRKVLWTKTPDRVILIYLENWTRFSDPFYPGWSVYAKSMVISMPKNPFT